MALPTSYNIGNAVVTTAGTYQNDNSKDDVTVQKAKNAAQILSASEDGSDRKTKHKSQSKIEKIPSQDEINEEYNQMGNKWPPAALKRIKDITTDLVERKKELNKANEEIAKLNARQQELLEKNKALETQIQAEKELWETFKTEKVTTEVSKDITNLKDELTKLNSDVHAIITLILNAVMKNEIPKEYSDNEKEIYAYASKAFEGNTGIQASLIKRLQEDKKTFVDIVSQRNRVFDDWNASQVLMERLNHNLNYLHQILAMPDHLKQFSNIAAELSKKVDALIERDYIDSYNFDVIGNQIKAEHPTIDEKKKLIEIKIRYEKLTMEKRQEALKAEHKELSNLLSNIISFKETHFDALQTTSQTEQISSIKTYFKSLNDKVKYWKELFSTNISPDYEIYRNERKNDLTEELKKTQDSFLKYHSELREWCSKTWNQTLNQLAIVNCKIELMEDRIQVYNEMKQTLAKVDALKGKALDAIRTLKADALQQKLLVLDPDFYADSKTIENHNRNYLDLMKKYEMTIGDITKKIMANQELAFKKELENQAFYPEMAREKVIQNVVDTHTLIRDLTKKQSEELKSQWEALFNKRYYDTSVDFDNIDNAVNPKSVLKYIGDSTRVTAGKYSQEYYNIRDGKPVSNGTSLLASSLNISTQEPAKQQ